MIEFKAWDKKNKKMIYPHSIPMQVGECSFSIELNGLFNVKERSNLTASLFPSMGSVVRDSGDFELFAWIGLTAKDNKKLFPGDIIQKEDEKPVTIGYGEYEESSNDSWGVKAKHFGPHIIFEDGGTYAITQDGSGYSIASGECDHIGHSYEQ